MNRGYITFVQNNDKVNYLNCAYLQALSLKVTNKINQYAVVVDRHTESLITQQHRKIFDDVISMPWGDQAHHERWKMSNEWKALIASPFDETIKLEADLLFTGSVDHWWDIMSLKDVCFTMNVTDYKENIATSRAYREVFDINNLPNIYAGFYYFKKTESSKQLFMTVKSIFENWDDVKNVILKNARSQPRSTDLAFALATHILGIENFYLPGNVPMFTHMKGAIQGWYNDSIWTDVVHHEVDKNYLTVGFQRQRLPFHYHYKEYANDSIIAHYERLYYEQT